MAASVAFYRRLGLTIPDVEGEWADWAPHHRSATTADGLDLDFDSVAFAHQWDRGWRSERGGIVLGFRVESREAVDELYEALTGAGSEGQQPPYDAGWGARYAIVTDPDGNAVGIMSPADPARRSALALP
jgi:uncharacterized glyoxalase superfamily protein PhnB